MKEPEPNPNDALQQFFNQLSEILSMVQAKKDQPPKDLPIDLEKRLERLEIQVRAFKKNNDDIMSNAGLSNERLQELTAGLPAKERRLIDYAERLKTELENIRRENTAKGAIAKKRKQSLRKDKGKERRKRFDQLGGRQDWKPL